MLIIGIDPGISGAICFFEKGKVKDVMDMPTMSEGKKNKKQINGRQIFTEISSRIENYSKEEISVVVEQVSAMIQTCALTGISMKCTAGLHHPIRHFADEYDSYMHGFINTFGAGIFTSNFPNPSNSQEKFRMFILLSHIIGDQKPENFEFRKKGMVWKVGDDRGTTFEFDNESINNCRKKVMISYGSCSFQEPIDDLKQLGWM